MILTRRRLFCSVNSRFARWTPLENGDGIVHIDEHGNRRTILRTSKDAAKDLSE
jgi:hypothetical protein